MGTVGYTLFNRPQYRIQIQIKIQTQIQSTTYKYSIDHNRERNTNSPICFTALQSTLHNFIAVQCLNIILSLFINYKCAFVWYKCTALYVEEEILQSGCSLYLNTNSIACRLPYWGGLLLCPPLYVKRSWNTQIQSGWKIRRNTEWNTWSENQQRACSHWNTGSRRLSAPYRGLTM